MDASMQYKKAVLQPLQHGRGPFTWILKTPIDLMMFDQLYAIYPDAWVVRTHRDPLKTAPSGASTMAACRFQRSDTVDLSTLAPPDVSGAGGTHDQMHAAEARLRAGGLPDRFVGYDGVFFGLNDSAWGAQSGFDQNQIFTALAWRIEEGRIFEIGYLNQFVRRQGGDELMNPILSINLLLRF